MVDVPEVDGAITQAKRLDQVPAMVADAVSLLEDIPAAHVVVTVVPMFEADEEAMVTEALDASREVAVAQARASRAMRAAATTLATRMPTRDVASVLRVSHQRVSQLVQRSRSVSRSVRPGPAQIP
ncbi:hypothetical protein [Mariniluteicoccus flavus]